MNQKHRDKLRHPSTKRVLVEALESRRLLSTAVLTVAAIPNPAAQDTQLRTELAPSAGGGALALPASYAFAHPVIPNSLEDLNTIKANLNQDPWKSGYAILAADSHSQLSYQMQGPFATVTRNPNLNLSQWRNDMTAVFNLSRMWFFTGNAAYAQKAHDILIAWATTQTSFGGQESGLDLGDYAFAYAGGADLLRGTWSGWTAADTATVKNYFGNVLWPATSASGNTAGPFNKGLLNLEAGIAIAAFCDDAAKFNHCIDLYVNYPGAGLNNTLPTGELGETGRDEGHSYAGLLAMAFISEVAWKEGVDLYSAMDNRLLACGEYYARNTLTTDNPFVPFGTVDYTYYANNPYSYNANRAALYLIQNAYKNRFGLTTPWIDRKLAQQNVDANNFMYARTADFSTATVQPSVARPTVALASSGLTLTTLGSQTAGRSASYSNGVWTLTGAGNNVWSDTTDDAQFDYQAMTGDGAMVVRLTSSQVLNTNTKAGLMIRDNLSATVSQRGWIGVTNGTLMESYMNGWTETWGGSNWAKRSQSLPPGLPYWLKIERTGNLITTYSSQDGTSWSAIESSYYGNLPSTLYVGMFVASGSSSTTTATFDNVAFTGGTGGLVTAPAAPATTFAEGSSKAITVRWLPSFGATAYDLLRSTTSGSGYTVIASNLSTDKTSYVDTAVSAGTTYFYVVRAKNTAGTSGNSPEFGDALLPAAMVNLAFSGTASASYTNTNPLEVPSEAFDGDPGSKWFDSGATTGWLQKDFGAGNAQVVKRYTISSADVAARDPKDWTFLGSNDGMNWTTLDSQTGQVFVDRMRQNTYNIANTTAYRYYRLNVTANNGDTTMAIAELGLWSDVGRTLADGTYILDNRPSHKVIDLALGGTPAVQQSWNGGNAQQWTLAWQGNGVYRATNVSSGKVIDNAGSSSAGSDVVVNAWSGANSQLWSIVADSDGFYHITSLNSGLAMDVSGASTADGANIVQSTYTGGDSQLWMPGFAAVPQPLPPAPTGLGATPASISTINLSWTASAGAVSYNIKRASVNGGPYTTIATGINTTSYQDTFLTANTTYYYVVSAMNGSGEGADSAQASTTTLKGAPAAPTGLTVQAGANQVTLNWPPTGGATSYTVKRTASSGGPYTTVASNLSGTTYTDTGLTAGLTYYYVVLAANPYGQSPNSSEASATPFDLAVRLKFDEGSGTTASDATGNSWPGTLVNGPVWSTGQINGAVSLDGTDDYVSLPTGVVSNLPAMTISAWVNLNAVSTWARLFDFGTGTNNYMFLAPKGGSNVLRFAIRTPSTAEQQINGAAALPAGSWLHVAVTLSGSTGTLYVNGVQVGQNTGMTLNPSSLGSTTQNYIGKSQFNDPYLNGLIDDFRIYNRALSASEVNALATTTVVPATPTSLNATPGDAQVSLSWSPAAGAVTYSVLRGTTAGGPYTPVAAGLTGTSWTDTTAANQSTYYYVVRAVNAVGESGNSNDALAMPNAAPTVASPAKASANPVTGKTATLSVLGADDAGEPNLLYSWSATGPAAVTFSDNGTNTASSVMATFAQAGTYTFTATITDAQGASTTSTVIVTVNQTLKGIAIVPNNNPNVTSGATLQFSATGTDQFGASMSVAPTWSVTGSGNSIGTNGLFTAGATAGSFTVTAASGSVSASVPVTVVSSSAFTGQVDFGNATSLPGSYSVSNGAYTLKGAGSDISGTSDNFHYVYVPFSGDGQIIARVSSVQNTSSWAKAGVMLRESLSANARNAFIALTPGHGVTFQRRTSAGGSTSSTQKTGIVAPQWVKLVRSGNIFQAFYSANGSTWTQLGSNQTIAMASSIYVGLAVTSHNSAALCTAAFDNVSITPYNNLASGKVATASSVAAGSSAANAVDGSLSTAWTSAAAGSQNLMIDLGSTKSISHLRLIWGANYGKSYSIQVGTNNSTWTTAYSTTTGAGGTVDVSGLLLSARYVRVLLTSGNTGTYVLNELSVFGM